MDAIAAHIPVGVCADQLVHVDQFVPSAPRPALNVLDDRRLTAGVLAGLGILAADAAALRAAVEQGVAEAIATVDQQLAREATQLDQWLGQLAPERN